MFKKHSASFTTKWTASLQSGSASQCMKNHIRHRRFSSQILSPTCLTRWVWKTQRPSKWHSALAIVSLEFFTCNASKIQKISKKTPREHSASSVVQVHTLLFYQKIPGFKVSFSHCMSGMTQNVKILRIQSRVFSRCTEIIRNLVVYREWHEIYYIRTIIDSQTSDSKSCITQFLALNLSKMSLQATKHTATTTFRVTVYVFVWLFFSSYWMWWLFCTEIHTLYTLRL